MKKHTFKNRIYLIFNKLFLQILVCCMVFGFSVSPALAAGIQPLTDVHDPNAQIVVNPEAKVAAGSNEMLRLRKSIEQTAKDNFKITLTADTKDKVEPLGISVVLVVDASASMNDGDKVPALKNAASVFVNEMFSDGASNINQVGVIDFDYEAYFGTPLTNNKDTLLEWFSGMTAGSNSTNIAAGLNAAQERLSTDARAGNKKVIVLMSDGQPNIPYPNPGATTIAAANAIKATGTEIHSIFLNEVYTDDPLNDMTAAQVSQGVASSGAYIEATDAQALAAAFKQIAEDLTESANIWKISDPMGKYINWEGFSDAAPSGASFESDNNTLIWNLLNAGVVPQTLTGDPAKFQYRYSMSYRISLDTGREGFTDGRAYPTNGETTLSYFFSGGKMTDSMEISFEVPQVKGYATPTITVVAADLIAYVGGTSQSNDPFPYPQFDITGLEEKDTIETLEFYLDGISYDSATHPTQYRLPFTEKFYLLNGDGIPADTPSLNDDIPGNYLITVEGIHGQTITAKSTIDGTLYNIAYGTGTLYVRGITDFIASTPAVISAPNSPVQWPTAVLAPETALTNSLGLPVSNISAALLADHLLVESTKENMLERLQNNEATKNMTYDFMYLDLVDQYDGNHVLTPDRPVTIYLPYPDGTNARDDFEILHLKGVNRHYNYNVSDIPSDWIKPTKTEYGLRFSVESFSPFALAYRKNPTHTITAAAGEGGTISSPGVSTFLSGENKNYTVTPNQGYRIKDVTVDDTSAGAVTTYTFQDINADHTIYASFEKTDDHLVSGKTEDEKDPASSGDPEIGNPTPSDGSTTEDAPHDAKNVLSDSPPRTGDITAILPYILFSGIAASVIVIVRKKKRHSR